MAIAIDWLFWTTTVAVSKFSAFESWLSVDAVLLDFRKSMTASSLLSHKVKVLIWVMDKVWKLSKAIIFELDIKKKRIGTRQIFLRAAIFLGKIQLEPIFIFLEHYWDFISEELLIERFYWLQNRFFDRYHVLKTDENLVNYLQTLGIEENAIFEDGNHFIELTLKV